MKNSKNAHAFKFIEKYHPVRDEYKCSIWDNATRIHNSYPYEAPELARQAAETWAAIFLEFIPYKVIISDHKLSDTFYCRVKKHGFQIEETIQMPTLQMAREAAVTFAREFLERTKK